MCVCACGNKIQIKTYTISRTQTSGFGTIGAAFLYFDALKRHAIFGYFIFHLVRFRSRIKRFYL